MTSCLARNDFNVAFSIITLMLLTNFYDQNPKATTKIIIQVISILILADIIWIILYSSAWEHNDESQKHLRTNETNKEFWDSLWFIHKIVYILAYLELILKCLLLYYLMANFKEKYRFRDLLNLNYDDGKTSISPHSADGQENNFENSMNNFVKESNYSYAEDFQNNY